MSSISHSLSSIGSHRAPSVLFASAYPLTVDLSLNFDTKVAAKFLWNRSFELDLEANLEVSHVVKTLVESPASPLERSGAFAPLDIEGIASSFEVLRAGASISGIIFGEIELYSLSRDCSTTINEVFAAGHAKYILRSTLLY